MNQKQFDQAQGALRLIFAGGDVVWFYTAIEATGIPGAPLNVNWATNAADRKKLAENLREIANKLETV